MAMNESDAVALVYYQGLGISCFNPMLDRFETAILRESGHSFSINIQKEANEQTYGIAFFDNIPREDVSIHITGLGNPSVVGYETYEPGYFDRTATTNDVNDLRWIVDMCQLHETELSPTGESGSEHDMPISRLYIKNAEFYTKAYTDYDTNIIVKDSGENVIADGLFGKYGYILGAKIIADTIEIEFGGMNQSTINLEKETGTVYKIFISNMREGEDPTSDFPEYYKVVEDLNGKTCNIVKVVDSGSYYCGMVFCRSFDTIDDLS